MQQERCRLWLGVAYSTKGCSDAAVEAGGTKAPCRSERRLSVETWVRNRSCRQDREFLNCKVGLSGWGEAGVFGPFRLTLAQGCTTGLVRV